MKKKIKVVIGSCDRLRYEYIQSSIFDKSDNKFYYEYRDFDNIENLANDIRRLFDKDVEFVVINQFNMKSKHRKFLFNYFKKYKQEVEIEYILLVQSFNEQFLYSRELLCDYKKKYVSQSLPRKNYDCHVFTTYNYQNQHLGFSLSKFVNSEYDHLTFRNFMTSLTIHNHFLTSELMLNFDSHDNFHHLESIEEHIDLVYNNSIQLADEYKLNKYDRRVLRLAAFFHDIGKGMTKLMTKSHDNVISAVYHSHELLSAYYAHILLTQLRVEDGVVSDVVTLIRHHMSFYNDNFNKDKYYKRHGIDDRLSMLLELLHKADKKGTIKDES